MSLCALPCMIAYQQERPACAALARTLALLAPNLSFCCSRRYADQLVEARKAKQLTKDQAYDLLQDLNMFGEGQSGLIVTMSRRCGGCCREETACCTTSTWLVGS